MSRLTKIITVLALGLGGLSGTGQARVYTVAAGDTAGLIAAIEDANRTPEADTIELARGLYVLKEVSAPERKSGLPAIRSPLVIHGNGAELRRYSNTDFRLLYVEAEGRLLLQRLTLAEGSLGAAVNHGALRLRHVQLVDHTAREGFSIVENYGELDLEHVLVGFNTVASATRDAGIIVNYGTARLRATRFEGNVVAPRYRSLAAASALLNLGQAELYDVQLLGNEHVLGVADGLAAGDALVNLGIGRVRVERLVDLDPSSARRMR